MAKQKTASLIPERPVFMVIDGHSMLFRAYYALAPQLAFTLRATGEPIGAVFNFVNMLLRAWQDVQPDYWAIAFDPPGKTFRDDMYAEYKMGRAPTPDELISQFARVHQVIEVLGMPSLEIAGYEADDVIGTLSRMATEHGLDTVILSGDTDEMQLVGPHVRIRYQAMRKGISETTMYDVGKVRERFGLEPRQVIDFKALKGDTSDNIPGVPGVGDKTATKLLLQYGDVEEIYKHLDSVTPERIQNALRENQEQAAKSKLLVTIETHVPLEFDFEQASMDHYHRDQVVQLFQELEFNSLIARLPGADTDVAASMGKDTQYAIVDSEQAMTDLVSALSKAGGFALDLQGTSPQPMSARLTGIAFSIVSGENWYVPLGHAEGKQLDKEQALRQLQPVLEDEAVEKVAHSGKYDTIVLSREGITLGGLTTDVIIAAYLLGAKALTIKGQAFERLAEEIPAASDFLGTGAKAVTIDQAPIDTVAGFACARAEATHKLWPMYRPELEEQGLMSLFTDVEMALLPVLAKIERWGVAVDVELLRGMSREMAAQIEGIETGAYNSIGHIFKINSPKELSHLLFEEIGLKGTKRTKQGWSTDASVLEKLRGQHPVIENILDYRQITKIKSTYVDALPEMVNPTTRRVHTTLSQTVAATGRLSSSDPNLQNIPVRTALGRRVRDAFIPQPGSGWTLLSADYSQIELRILAHMTQDPNLLEAFKRDEDIHAATAARIYDVPLDEVTEDQRRFAKVVNFGLIYGMGEFGLATRADIARDEAAPIIAEYFKKYPSIERYIEETKAIVREQGYVETILGRRRYIPEANAANNQVRAAGERMAINHPIQGSAADAIKVGMINLQRRMDDLAMKTKMILQVHDELIFEAPGDELETIRDLVLEVMPAVMDLSVPLKVDLKQGQCWGQME